MIKKIRINHFKSLASIDLSMDRITVIVGANGSGKSNFVDAFRFLRDCASDGIDHAINQRGGPSLVREYASTRPFNVNFEVVVEEGAEDEHFYCEYSFAFSSSYESITIEQEQYKWTEYTPRYIAEKHEIDHVEQSFFGLRSKSGDIAISTSPSEPGDVVMQKFREDTLALGVRIHHEEYPLIRLGGSLARALGDIRFSSIYPNIMREPTRVSTEGRLREDCSNWGSILRLMRARPQSNEILKRVVEQMRIVMPQIVNVRVTNAGGYLIPQFLVDDPTSHKKHYLDPVQLSDGTLRIFGILLALNQTPPPHVLAIEEPEQTIHPGLLALLVDVIKEAATHTQVLITTHSPHLLDYFDIDFIRVAHLEEGRTKISQIRKSQVETIKRRLMSASEVMALDGLKPEP